MPSNNIKPVIRNQVRQIRPTLFYIFPSFDIFSLNKRLTTPLSVGSIHFKQSSVSWAELALRKVTPTARHQESLLLYVLPGRRLTIEQQNFNIRMNSMRQAVEWGFGNLISEFAF
jgi:hypothetical protein